MQKSPHFLILVALLVGYGCCTQRGKTWSNLLDKTLTPTELNGVEVAATMEESPTLTFHKKERRLGGFGGCNNFFGSYKISDNKLTINEIGSTKKACIGIEGDTERALFKVLRNANTIAFSGDTLLLKSGEQVIGKFVVATQKEKAE